MPDFLIYLSRGKMRKHNRLLSIFFLSLLASAFDMEFPRQIRAEENPLPKYAVHYIQPGDNLHLLAAYFLNSPRKWEIIFNENREVIKNPNQLAVGKKIVIPVSKSWTRVESYEKFKMKLSKKLDVDDLATELLLVSKIYGKIQNLPSLIKKEIERDSLQLGGTPEQIDMLNKKVTEKMVPAAIIARITTRLKTSVDEAELRELFNWYTSPLGIKITGLVHEETDPDKWKTAPGVSERVREARDKDVKRVEILHDFDLSARYTEREVELKRSIFFAAASVSFNKNGEADKNYEELRAFVNERKSDLFAELEDEMIFRLMYIYEELSDRELNKYAGFLKTSASQKFTEIVSKTLNELIVSSFSPTPQNLPL